MTFVFTKKQRAICNAFEALCRELCIGRMTSIQAGFLGSCGIVTGGVQDGIKVYWPDGYKYNLADRLQLSIQYMTEAHAEKTVEEQKIDRLQELERQAEILRRELGQMS